MWHQTPTITCTLCIFTFKLVSQLDSKDTYIVCNVWLNALSCIVCWSLDVHMYMYMYMYMYMNMYMNMYMYMYVKCQAVSEWSTLAAATAVGSARQHWSMGRRADLAIAAAKAVNSDAASVVLAQQLPLMYSTCHYMHTYWALTTGYSIDTAWIK